ncbi:MAG: peptide deformylase [Actinomycetia bacterium]|nr:peptide deformylase [Actinomycetes bacterium]
MSGSPTGRVLPILVAGAPGLEQPSAPVEPGDPHLPAAIADLTETLADFRVRIGFGRAISAPQVGIYRRLIVVDLGHGPLVLVNPEITWRSAETRMVWDDCLSVPDVLVRVERHASISVRHQTQRFETVERERLPADMAELLQHEIDHLDGVLMTARAGGPDSVVPMARRAELIPDR